MPATINKVLFLFLRRMRAPLLALTAAYSISVLGLVLIPGVDDQGEPWRMDFFHAFYFVTYMATTIGFGEIDNPAHHNVYELFEAIVVNIIATALKLGDRTQTGALLLAS